MWRRYHFYHRNKTIRFMTQLAGIRSLKGIFTIFVEKWCRSCQKNLLAHPLSFFRYHEWPIKNLFKCVLWDSEDFYVFETTLNNNKMQMLCLCVTELIFKCVNVIFKFAKKFYAQCLSKKFISAREKVYLGHCADFGLHNIIIIKVLL